MSLLSEMSSLNPSVDLMELHSMGRPSLDLHSTQPFLELEAPMDTRDIRDTRDTTDTRDTRDNEEMSAVTLLVPEHQSTSRHLVKPCFTHLGKVTFTC